RNAEGAFRQHRRGSGKSGNIACPCRPKAGFGAMRPPQAEFNKQLAWRGQHEACSLGGDQRLKMQDVDQARFNKLGLVERRSDAQNWLASEKNLALRHRVYVTGKAKRRELSH